MSFSTKIQNYTNSVSNESVADALKKGLDYVIGTVNSLNPDMLRLFAYKIDLNTNTGEDIDWERLWNLSYLIDVKRSGKFCRPVSDRMASDLGDSSSIYYALASDPAYYLDSQGRLTIKPATSTSAKGEIYGVPLSNGRTINDSAETVTITGWTQNGISYIGVANQHFPLVFQELMLLHASECILMERLADFRAKLPTDLDADTTPFDAIADIDASITYTFPSSDFQDAVDKAKNLIDGTTMGGDTENESAQYWLADEDEDMVASTLSVAGQELQRANAYLSEFNAEINAKVTDKSQELKEFQANLQKKMSLFDKLISKITVDYQWAQGQLQMIGQKKQEFIQTNISIGPTGDPEKESKI